MATIENAFLSVQLKQNSADVVVVADVNFGQNESSITSRVECRVLGDDPLIDDFLFAFPTHFFIELGSSQSVRFERDDVPLRLLNEDIIGADEIVAELTLKLATGPSVVKRTNVFQIR